jgi:hypothetical protein
MPTRIASTLNSRFLCFDTNITQRKAAILPISHEPLSRDVPSFSFPPDGELQIVARAFERDDHVIREQLRVGRYFFWAPDDAVCDVSLVESLSPVVQCLTDDYFSEVVCPITPPAYREKLAQFVPN